MLTLLNPKMGHHHGPKFGEGGQMLENQERKARLAEYHKMTNERRKQINEKVQKKRDIEQKEINTKLAEEQRENKVKLDRVGVSPGRPKQNKAKGKAKKTVLGEDDSGISGVENAEDLAIKDAVDNPA